MPAAGSSPTATAATCWTTASSGRWWTVDGLLASLVDYATGREAIAPGVPGNLLELHRDTPNEWDAWDIDEFYRRNVTPLTEAAGR